MSTKKQTEQTAGVGPDKSTRRATVKLASLFLAVAVLVGCEGGGGYYSAAPAIGCGGYYPAAVQGYTVMSPAGMTVVSPDGLGGFMVMGPNGSAMVLPNGY